MFTTRSKLTALIVALIAINGMSAQYRAFGQRDIIPAATTTPTATPTVTTPAPTTTTTTTTTVAPTTTVNTIPKQTLLTNTVVTTGPKQVITVAPTVVTTPVVAQPAAVTVLKNSYQCEQQYGATEGNGLQICANDGKLYTSLNAAKCMSDANTSVVLTCMKNEIKCGARCNRYVKKNNGTCKLIAAGSVSVCGNDGNLYNSASQKFCAGNQASNVFLCYASMNKADCETRCMNMYMKPTVSRTA